MPNNYDAAAWFYDRLAQLVFGKALVKAQRFLVEFIPPNTNILIVGGGTGWILEEIARIHPSSLNITYIEISGRMIKLSEKRNYLQNKVSFIHQTIEDCEIPEQFDVILTPFLFDNFSEQRIKAVFNQLHQNLKAEGLWLLSDFQIQNNYKGIWQKIMLKIMYWFFGWLCNVETDQLIKMDQFFAGEKYDLQKENTFYNGFIISQVYKKRLDF